LRADFFLAMGRVYQNASRQIDLNVLSFFFFPLCSFVSFVVKVFAISILAVLHDHHQPHGAVCTLN
jgi:hypothetical protein